MRRTLSLVLCIVMMLSLCLVSAGAAEGTKITTAEEFAAMTADGKYFLDADITLSATYETPFTGVFDGNGHKITTTVPIFNEVKGTIRNLTVDGTVTVADGYAAAVAMQTSKTDEKVVFENIVNNAAVTGPSTTAAILAYGTGDTNVLVKNCVNNGKIDGGSQTGSMIGYCQGKTVDIEGCTNNGEIIASKTYGGGIIGRFGKDKVKDDGYVINITGCVNNGNINGTKDQIGGIIGYVIGIVNIVGCENHGSVTTAAGCAGGILGQTASNTADYVRASGVLIKDCLNTGNITGVTRAAGIAATVGRLEAYAGHSYRVEHCRNTGNVTVSGIAEVDAEGAGIVSYMWGGNTGNGIFDCVNEGKVTVSNDKIPAGSEKLAIAAGIIAYFNSKNCTVSGCANTGEIVNNAANGAVNECLSLFFNKNADGCAAENNSCKEIPGVTVYEVNGTVPASYKFITEAPEPVPTPVTADGVVWFVFAAVVAIIGMALAVRERKAD